MKWTDLPVHVIDFEGSVRTGVVEFGIVTIEGAAVQAVETRVCGVPAAVPEHETLVHGLATGDLRGAAPFAAEWTRFAALRERGVLAAHFSTTENLLLRAAWPCPRLSPDFLNPGRETAEWGPWIDTGRLACEWVAHAESARLEDVVAALGLGPALAGLTESWCPATRRRFHCAAYDALASALVLLAVAREPDGTPWSLARVLAQSTGNGHRRAERQQAQLF